MPWPFWTSRANSEPLPVKSNQDTRATSPLVENSEPSWSAHDKVYATSAPGGWDQQPEPQPASQPYIIQPEDSLYQPLDRPLVLNRMDSPLQEPEESVSSILRGVHEDEMRELVAVIKELREQAARDAELITELRGQAEDNAHAIGVLRIENERLVKEMSAAAAEAREAVAVAAAAASAASAASASASAAAAAAAAAANSPPPPSPPAPAPQTTGEPRQVPYVSTPTSPRTTPTSPPFIPESPINPPSSTAVPQGTPLSPNLTMFETYDHMVNLLKTKPRSDVHLGDYPWPMFPEPAGSFPPRITLRSDVKKEKVYAFVQGYTSVYGPAQRKERGEAMVRAWKSIMDRSEDIILKGTAARACTYMDMAARSL